MIGEMFWGWLMGVGGFCDDEVVLGGFILNVLCLVV